MKKVLGIFLICVSATIAHSQKVKEFRTFQKSAVTSENIRVIELSSSIQPTIYYNRGQEKVRGNSSPTVIISDVHSTQSLGRAIESFKNVELIEIRIKDRQEVSSFDINKNIIENGPNLKAILIRTEFPFSESEFKNLFKNILNTNIILLYEVSLPQ